MNTRAFYEARAKSLIKDLREERGISYKELARRLEAEGAPVDVQVLINRVNQGKFTFSFALQLLAAMGVETLDVPKPVKSEGKKAKERAPHRESLRPGLPGEAKTKN